jgi:Mn-dependent DtxR family transcriptional regulator
MVKKILKSGEDYLEAIYNLSKEENHAHNADISRLLGVSKPSTFIALQKLEDLGLIYRNNYGPVTLTESGEEYAMSIIKKHQAIKKLLTDVLKVSEFEAEIDACKIEHCIGDETTTKLYDFLKINH